MKGVKAKKHLGQHFLNDKNLALKITNLLNKEIKNVIEIGPGMGMLTQFLIQNNYTTSVIEIDTESVAYLKLKYPKLNIYKKDFLKINLKEKYPFQFSLIGNFPYNISSQILLRSLIIEPKFLKLLACFKKK